MFQATVTDARGNVTRYDYDLLDRLALLTDPMYRRTQFAYTVLSQPYRTYNTAIQAAPLLEQAWTNDGLRASLKDANGNTTGFTYDRFDRLVTTTYPGGSTETATWDANANMLTRKTRAGATLRYAYDTLNRVVTKTAAATPVACSAATSTTPTPTVTYSYNLVGRVTGVCDNGSAISAITPPSTVGIYNTAYTYDATNRPTGVAFDPAPTPTLPSAASATSFDFGYNAANQRVSFAASDNAWVEYAVGPTSTTGYTANNLNQYTAVGAVAPGYDGNGNLTSDGTFTFGYDTENRLISASKTGTSASYAFDAQGRRKRKAVTVGGTTTTTLFVTGADNREVLEYDATGAIQRWYAYGLGANDVLAQAEIGAGTRLTPTPDLLGSIVATMDANSGALTRFGYKPYGASSSTPSQFAFTGQRVDLELSGLYYFRARHFSPILGRFIQSDPIGYKNGSNLYAYANDDPLNVTDPSGLDSQLTLSGQVTLAAFVGLGFSVSGGINIPDNHWDLRGYGLVFSGQANWMAGGGIYLGAGAGAGLAHSPGPVTTGLSTSSGWYMEADAGWGPGSVGVSIQGPGALFSRDMGIPNAASVAISPGMGAGVFVGYGGQTGFSLAGTIGGLMSVVSGDDIASRSVLTSNPNYYSQAFQAVGSSSGVSSPQQLGDTSIGGLLIGLSNDLGSRKTWK